MGDESRLAAPAVNRMSTMAARRFDPNAIKRSFDSDESHLAAPAVNRMSTMAARRLGPIAIKRSFDSDESRLSAPAVNRMSTMAAGRFDPIAIKRSFDLGKSPYATPAAHHMDAAPVTGDEDEEGIPIKEQSVEEPAMKLANEPFEVAGLHAEEGYLPIEITY